MSGTTVDVFEELAWLARIIVRLGGSRISRRGDRFRPRGLGPHGCVVIRDEIDALSGDLIHR